MTNEDVHELAAAYALDALTADERQAFEVHLRDCERCRAELETLEDTVGALAFATEAPAPAIALRERVLVAAREEPPTVVALRPRRMRLYAGAAVAVAASAALAIGLWAGLSGESDGPKLALSLQPSGTAQVAVSGFDPAPTGKVYEIWVIVPGRAPARAGLFEGGGKQTITLTRPAPAGSTVAVTLEKAGGVQAPTTKPLRQTVVSV
jgi:anti-sigma-K factor RskA